MVTMSEDEYNASNGVIAHYGTPRHSGRYPWGSGEDDSGSRRNQTLLDTVNEMKKKGLSETDIAKGMGMTTTQLRDLRTIARNELQQDQIHMAQRLKDKGMSNGAIAQRMREAGYKVNGESQVRALLKPSQERKASVLDNVTDTLRRAVDQKEFLDVGAGTEFLFDGTNTKLNTGSIENKLGITSTKLRSALRKLQTEGYNIREVKVQQLGTGNLTNMKVLVKPGVEWADVQRNRDKIAQLTEYSDDGGRTSLGILPPLSISSKRVGVRYAEDGGTEADGVIYVRPGVKDVSLGSARYSQVRVMVDDSHYLKGMAIYKDDLPAGVDLQFNTNKSNTGNKLDAMKKITDDPDNPFGATVRQIGEKDRDGKVKKLTSVMNLVNSEGDWDKWSKSLSSQFLSKQRPKLAREQLDLTYTKKKSELDAILALNNPSVKKKLLAAYADGADSSAIHLKAAYLPRQKTQVLLPLPDIKPGEVYAPNFNNGEHVALVRFPHGGTFEIPELVVNNNTPSGRKLLGPGAIDAIGIHPKVAERLSGADFDGDSVLVIPNNLGKVKSTPALEGLRNFNPKDEYPEYPGMKRMTSYEKGLEMGNISNLITDMTIQRASTDEVARAVRHSMVVIDAEKHNLDFRRSAKENGIAALKTKYQGGARNGAATLISRATSRQDVLERKDRSAAKGGPIDPKTGKKVFEETGRAKTWTDAKGKVHVRPNVMESVKLAETDNAHTLSSGTVIEKDYADHSNRLKALANQARKELVTIKAKPYSPSAKKTHQSAVDTLSSKLTLALRNAPRERQAQVFANHTVNLKVQANPELKLRENRAELKRVKSQALAAARLRTKAAKTTIDITDIEWAAIQAGAIAPSRLDKILTYADLKQIKELATPRTTIKMTPTKISKAKALFANGYTTAEVAEALGVSVTTVRDAVDDGEGD